MPWFMFDFKTKPFIKRFFCRNSFVNIFVKIDQITSCIKQKKALQWMSEIYDKTIIVLCIFQSFPLFRRQEIEKVWLLTRVAERSSYTPSFPMPFCHLLPEWPLLFDENRTQKSTASLLHNEFDGCRKSLDIKWFIKQSIITFCYYESR